MSSWVKSKATESKGGVCLTCPIWQERSFSFSFNGGQFLFLTVSQNLPLGFSQQGQLNLAVIRWAWNLVEKEEARKRLVLCNQQPGIFSFPKSAGIGSWYFCKNAIYKTLHHLVANVIDIKSSVAFPWRQ